VIRVGRFVSGPGGDVELRDRDDHRAVRSGAGTWSCFVIPAISPVVVKAADAAGPT